MKKSNIQTSNPGKLILLGEYAVLEQAPCLVAAADRNCTVQVVPTDHDFFKLEASNADIADVKFTIDANNRLTFTSGVSSLDRERLRFVIAVLNEIIDDCGAELEPAIIKIDTTNFYHVGSGDKLGLGASAAITVTLLSALRKYVQRPIDGKALYKAAFPIHRRAQGKLGSGSDIAASSVGGIIQYQMPADVEEGTGTIQSLDWPEGLHVIPVWAGKSASTQNMVQQIRTFRKKNPSSYQDVMEPMIALSRKGCQAFAEGDVDIFQEICSDYMGLEQKLGQASQTDIISDAHKQIATVVEEASGAYKPSGAGRGDMGVAFCNGLASKEKVAQTLQRSSFDIVDLSLQTQDIKAQNISTVS